MSKNNDPNETYRSRNEESTNQDEPIPPRRVLHPSNKQRWYQAFHLTLLLLFIALMIGLIAWGWRSTGI